MLGAVRGLLIDSDSAAKRKTLQHSKAHQTSYRNQNGLGGLYCKQLLSSAVMAFTVGICSKKISLQSFYPRTKTHHNVFWS